MIRRDVEAHEKRMSSWKGWFDCAFHLPVVLLLLPLVIGHGLYERATEKKRRRARGACVRCGHVHSSPLFLARDAHGWDEEMRLCRGAR